MKTVAQNRRARHDYDIAETLEAGIMLTGPEVKSCRGGTVQLGGAYVVFLGGKPFLRGATIAPYAFADRAGSDPVRDRQLLLHRKEQERLAAAIAEKGVTAVPLEVRAGAYIKVVIGIGRGRKKLDKRAAIKKKEIARKLREGREI